jgi:biopolymer transport protein ExbD
MDNKTMKKYILMFLMLSVASSFAEEAIKEPENPLANFKMETHKSKILKVFFATDGNARFVAYKVMWRSQEIIITDMFCEIPKNVGDDLTFMSQSLKMPNMGKAGINARKSILQFIALPEINMKAVINVNIPDKAPKEVKQEEGISIFVYPKTYKYSGREFDLKALKEVMKKIDKEKTINIKVDEAADHKSLVLLLDVINKQKFKKFNLHTLKETVPKD